MHSIPRKVTFTGSVATGKRVAAATAKDLKRTTLERGDNGGYFCQPTILADVTDGIAIVDEEQFGPALPVVAYTDVEDAVRRANATHFGLSGSVWGADAERAADVAAQLECGTAWVNTHRVFGPHQPFGGHRASGLGVDDGPWVCASSQILRRSTPC